jgi:hypothetical protein
MKRLREESESNFFMLKEEQEEEGSFFVAHHQQMLRERRKCLWQRKNPLASGRAGILSEFRMRKNYASMSKCE